MPKVSVIVPVYNASLYIEKCISSIANQTLRDIEIIAINDGSTDNSLEILERLTYRYNDKLRVLDIPNRGAGGARNLGLDCACGEFIKFVDADDYLNLNVLEKMYNIAKDYNVSLVRGNYKTIIGPFKFLDKCNFGNISGSKLIDVVRDKDYIVTETPGIGNKLIKRDLIGDMRFLENTKWEDLSIMPIVIADSKKLFHMDNCVYNYRINLNTTIKDFVFPIDGVWDIIKCVDNIEYLMKERGMLDCYAKQVESIYILHTLFRVENAMHWVNFSKFDKSIVISSLISILDIKYPNWRDNLQVLNYMNSNFLFKYDMNNLDNFINDDYRILNKREACNNIKLVLKK